jgi:hypothetical protein
VHSLQALRGLGRPSLEDDPGKGRELTGMLGTVPGMCHTGPSYSTCDETRPARMTLSSPGQAPPR